MGGSVVAVASGGAFVVSAWGRAPRRRPRHQLTKPCWLAGVLSVLHWPRARACWQASALLGGELGGAGMDDGGAHRVLQRHGQRGRPVGHAQLGIGRAQRACCPAGSCARSTPPPGHAHAMAWVLTCCPPGRCMRPWGPTEGQGGVGMSLMGGPPRAVVRQ